MFLWLYFVEFIVTVLYCIWIIIIIIVFVYVCDQCSFYCFITTYFVWTFFFFVRALALRIRLLFFVRALTLHEHVNFFSFVSSHYANTFTFHRSSSFNESTSLFLVFRLLLCYYCTNKVFTVLLLNLAY